MASGNGGSGTSGGRGSVPNRRSIGQSEAPF